MASVGSHMASFWAVFGVRVINFKLTCCRSEFLLKSMLVGGLYTAQFDKWTLVI